MLEKTLRTEVASWQSVEAYVMLLLTFSNTVAAIAANAAAANPHLGL
jgi:hypothetical protein